MPALSGRAPHENRAGVQPRSQSTSGCEQLAVDLREILARQGTTALYVTHDHGEARAVADLVGVMEAGRLLRLDAPEALWADPGSEKVARFLGLSTA